MKLTDEQREKCRQAENAIFSAFAWDASDEGYGYWSKVRNKLLALAKPDPNADIHAEIQSIRARLDALEKRL